MVHGWKLKRRETEEFESHNFWMRQCNVAFTQNKLKQLLNPMVIACAWCILAPTMELFFLGMTEDGVLCVFFPWGLSFLPFFIFISEPQSFVSNLWLFWASLNSFKNFPDFKDLLVYGVQLNTYEVLHTHSLQFLKQSLN